VHRYAILEAPSVLGLFPRGVEHLPQALLAAGLGDAIGARHAGRVDPPPYDPVRDERTGLLNPDGLAQFATALAAATTTLLDGDEVPVVLGGDCSILLGPLLALRRRGRFGLAFLDGHADFYQPAQEPNGEAASMDLALATGRGPEVVADLEGRAPLVRDEDVVHLGRRDAEEAAEHGSLRIEDSDIRVIDLDEVRGLGADAAAQIALDRLAHPDLDGFWLHLDCDVVDDELMPAVDYRAPGGLSWSELRTIVGVLAASGRMVGLEVTIFNPALDPDGAIARSLVACLGPALHR
jgi:arginase